MHTLNDEVTVTIQYDERDVPKRAAQEAADNSTFSQRARTVAICGIWLDRVPVIVTGNVTGVKRELGLSIYPSMFSRTAPTVAICST